MLRLDWMSYANADVSKQIRPLPLVASLQILWCRKVHRPIQVTFECTSLSY